MRTLSRSRSRSPGHRRPHRFRNGHHDSGLIPPPRSHSSLAAWGYRRPLRNRNRHRTRSTSSRCIPRRTPGSRFRRNSPPGPRTSNNSKLTRPSSTPSNHMPLLLLRSTTQRRRRSRQLSHRIARTRSTRRRLFWRTLPRPRSRRHSLHLHRPSQRTSSTTIKRNLPRRHTNLPPHRRRSTSLHGPSTSQVPSHQLRSSSPQRAHTRSRSRPPPPRPPRHTIPHRHNSSLPLRQHHQHPPRRLLQADMLQHSMVPRHHSTMRRRLSISSRRLRLPPRC